MEMNVEGMPLFEYGIFQEDSNIRAHIGVKGRTIFVYRTPVMRDLIIKNNYSIGHATQKGVNGITGEGWLVPIKDIPDLREIKWRSYPWWESFSEDDPTVLKGQKAVKIIIELLRQGRFPLWINDVRESFSSQIQISGTDILIVLNQRIQVKCDYKAGHIPFGSGNLFIQKAELNPFKLK